MTAPADIIEMALAVQSPADLDNLWQVLDTVAPHHRPVGDRWGNRGLFTAAGGTFDLKLVELATNMHDAVIHAAAVERHGSATLSAEAAAGLYPSPAAAVADLLGNRSRQDAATLARVELRPAGEHRRDRTIVYRDRGIGMRRDELPAALYRVGSSRKDGVLWQLGAFGRGGLTVLPNCYGWVVVTRRMAGPTGDPPSRHGADEIVVSAVRWEPVGNRQTETALYQVTEPWRRDGDVALPPAFAAADHPAFDPGTQIAVVGFHAEGIWVSRLGDERSIDTLLDTRLFDSPLPLSLTAPVLKNRAERVTVLRGLGRRLEDNPRTDRREGKEDLPFQYRGTTYHLPVHFYIFPSGDAGHRRRFVAKDHALLLNSNGQVHAHWTPAEFRQKTRLPKLADRILIVVDTDALPLAMRTALFTADRTELLRNAEAVRLESELVAFLDDWDVLWDANSALVREAIRRSNANRSTLALAQKIARAASLRSARPQTPNAPSTRRRPPAPTELHEDPSRIQAQREVIAVRGRTRGVYFSIDARDGFIPRRSRCRVLISHLDIDADTDVTIGDLRNGRLRIAVAVPPDAEPCDAEMTVVVDEWIDSTGGLRQPLKATIRLVVVADDPRPAPPPRPSGPDGDPGTGEAPLALLWSSHEIEPGWTPRTVGSLELVDAGDLASAHDDYRELHGHHFDVPVVKLNEEYAPLKAYVSMRARIVGDEGVARAKDRYALGVGVDFVLLGAETRKLRDAGVTAPEAVLDAAHASSARAVLAVLPDFDKLSSEAGLNDI